LVLVVCYVVTSLLRNLAVTSALSTGALTLHIETHYPTLLNVISFFIYPQKDLAVFSIYPTKEASLKVKPKNRPGQAGHVKFALDITEVDIDLFFFFTVPVQ